MLYGGGLARLLIDCVDRDAVLAALENLRAAELFSLLRPVRNVEKSAIWVHMDRASGLARAPPVGLGQCGGSEQQLWLHPAVLHAKEADLVLRLDREKYPGLGWMEVEVARPKAPTAIWRNRDRAAQQSSLVIKDLDSAWLFGASGGAFVSAGDQDGQLVV